MDDAEERAKSLREQIAALTKTLAAREEESAAVRQRTQEVLEETASLRRKLHMHMDSSNDTEVATEAVTKDIRIAREEGTRKEAVLATLRETIKQVDGEIEAVRRKRDRLVQQVTAELDAAEAIATRLARRERMVSGLDPYNSIERLTRIADEAEEVWRSSVQGLAVMQDRVEEQVGHVVDAHQRASSEVARVSREKEQLRCDIEVAWHAERDKLVDAYNAAVAIQREVAFHAKRGTSVVLPGEHEPTDATKKKRQTLAQNVATTPPIANEHALKDIKYEIEEIKREVEHAELLRGQQAAKQRAKEDQLEAELRKEKEHTATLRKQLAELRALKTELEATRSRIVETTIISP